MIFFTRKSKDQSLKEEFYSLPNTVCEDIHFWCDNLLFRLFSVHYYSFYINRHKRPHVFSSNSTFFYDMLPFLKKDTIKTELLHNFTFGKKGMEFFGLANYKRLTYRIVYDSFTLSNIKKQYTDFKINQSYTDRILFIEPGVDVPPPTDKTNIPPINILYAGRGGVQKRIHLLNQIAEYFIKNNLSVRFHFAGTMVSELNEIVKNNSIVYGEISDKQKMYALYAKCHAILLTSAYEGFPMLIKEGMANGCVPVVTALEGNKMHLKDHYNALLIENIENEEMVINEGIGQISRLLNTPELLEQLSHQAYAYAEKHFQKTKFTTEYRNFLLTH